MTGDGGAQLVFLLLAISLPLSALIARRMPAGTWLRMALLWALIILATLAVVAGVRMVSHRMRGDRPEPSEAASTAVHFT